MDALVQYSDSDQSDHEGASQEGTTPPKQSTSPRAQPQAALPPATLTLPSADALLSSSDTPMLLSPTTGAKRTATTSLTAKKPPTKVQRGAKQPTTTNAMLPPQLKGRYVRISCVCISCVCAHPVCTMYTHASERCIILMFFYTHTHSPKQ